MSHRILVYAADPESCRALAADVLCAGFDPCICERGAQHIERLAGDCDAWLVEGACIGEIELDWLTNEGAARSVVGATTCRAATGGAAHSRLRPVVQRVCLVPDELMWLRDALPVTGCDLLSQPYSIPQLRASLLRAVERSRLNRELHELRRRSSQTALRALVGSSPAMQMLRGEIDAAARGGQNVLVCGEPGSGIGAVARTIHQLGRRSHRPLVAVDCSVLTFESLERELFGSRAEADRHDVEPASRLAQAAGGTLLLGEVQCAAESLQQRLLDRLPAAALKRPDCDGRHSASDVCVVGTTSVASAGPTPGSTSGPLVSVLARWTIAVPPLRERRNDIAALAEHFLQRQATREGRAVGRLTLDALRALEAHDWPGNVRELQNVIERACAIEGASQLTAERIAPWLSEPIDEAELPGLSLKDMERKLIETTFTRCGGNRERTAQALKIGIRTLSGKLREYGYPPRGGPGSNRHTTDRRAA